MKTSELTGAALDWAVAQCEGFKSIDADDLHYQQFQYTTDWSQGGPIIEREKMCVDWWRSGNCWCALCPEKMAYTDKGEFIDGSDGMMHGPTPLIAAMRCYVSSRLGDTVEVPDELA
jgi:Protein of unknown function (DUF2591)